MWSHMWNWGGMVMMGLVSLLILALLIGLIVQSSCWCAVGSALAQQ
jgi:hypothetical protein